MKQSQITGVLVDVNAGTVREITIDETLDSYYQVLNCRCIDIVSRKLGAYRFDVICDDEGLLIDNPRVSAFDADGKPMLAGNLFFRHHDEEGYQTSLLPGEADFIRSRAHTITYLPAMETWKAIIRLNY